MVDEQILSIEEFFTVLAQVEAVLNYMFSMSDDPNDLAVLSPGHFLTTEFLVFLPGLTPVPLSHLDR